MNHLALPLEKVGKTKHLGRSESANTTEHWPWRSRKASHATGSARPLRMTHSALRRERPAPQSAADRRHDAPRPLAGRRGHGPRVTAVQPRTNVGARKLT